MLVITRRTGERIRIGTGTWLTVIDVGRGKVRLGIEALPGVDVAREELLPAELQYPATGTPFEVRTRRYAGS